jgi:undecaprenyl-diphosphatase
MNKRIMGINALKKQLSYVVILVPSVFLIFAALTVGDYELFELINLKNSNSVLDVACVYASPVLFFIFYFLTLATLYISHEKTSIATGLISFMTGLLSYSVGSLMKLLIKSPRPFDILVDVRVIGSWETGSFSFPSTTTMLVFGFALPILFLFEKRHYGIILSILSYFIGFSVIYAGFHFPTDVAAGIVISFCIAACASRMKGLVTNFLERKRVTLQKSFKKIQIR